MNLLAMILGVFQMFFYALEAIFEKKALKSLHPIKLQFLEYLFVLPLALFAALAFKPSFEELKLAGIPALFWILGTFFYFSVLNIARAHEYALIAASYPVFTLLLSILLLGERPSFKFFLAFVLMMLAFFLAS